MKALSEPHRRVRACLVDCICLHMIPDTTQAALASDLDGTMSVELDPKDTVHSIAAVRLLGQI